MNTSRWLLLQEYITMHDPPISNSATHYKVCRLLGNINFGFVKEIEILNSS